MPNRESWLLKKYYREVFHQIDHPPHHFLYFSSKALSNCLSNLGFNNAKATEGPLKIRDTTAFLTVIIFKDAKEVVARKLRKNVLGCEYGGEGTSVYKDAHFYRRVIFKTMKLTRDLIFLIPAIFVKLTTKGTYLYFQVQKPA